MHKIISAATKATETKCQYFDRTGKRCKLNAIQSHSLQKRGPLATIAEDGHVIKVGPSLKARPIEERSFLEKLGVKQASTFLGFCAKHDTEVFEEIESSDFSISQRTTTVLAIRSIALELYKKRVMVELQRKTIDFLGPQASSESLQRSRLRQRGAKQAVEAGTQNLKRLFRDYHKSPPSNFRYVCLEFDKPLPFACTGAFEPEWSLNGDLLYRCNPMKTGWNFVAFFCGNIGDRFFATFSGYQKFRNHRIDNFLRSIDTAAPDLTATLLTVSLAYSENCFIQPRWLVDLPTSEHEKIRTLITSRLLEGLRDPLVFALKLPVPQANLVSYIRH